MKSITFEFHEVMVTFYLQNRYYQQKTHFQRFFWTSNITGFFILVILFSAQVGVKELKFKRLSYGKKDMCPNKQYQKQPMSAGLTMDYRTIQNY